MESKLVFIENLLRLQHYVMCITSLVSLKHLKTLWGGNYYNPHFAVEKTEARWHHIRSQHQDWDLGVWPGACALDLCALLLLSKEKLPRTSFEKRSLEGNRSPVFHTWYFDGECMIVPAAHLASYHFPSSRWDPAPASFLLTCVVLVRSQRGRKLSQCPSLKTLNHRQGLQIELYHLPSGDLDKLPG